MAIIAMTVAARRGPMISIAATTGLPEAIRAAGRDPDPILRAAGLNPTIVGDRHGFIPCVAFAHVLEDAARATGDDCFGLHFGERYHPKDIGILTYVVLNSPTMRVAFENVARYLQIFNEAATVSLVFGEQRAYLQHLLSEVPVASRRQHEEYSLAVGINVIRLMAGSDWVPVEVQFEHAAPARTSEHARIFGAPVVFRRERNGFVIEREFCDRTVPAADRRLYPVLERELARLLAESPSEDGVVTAVRRAIGDALRHGDPQLAQVAQTVALSVRTLQRRLRESRVDFKGLVDDTRHRLAIRYLRQRQHTFTEVAYLLGYSELSAFNRAFKRWTGSTPSAYRRGLRDPGRA